MALVPVSTRNRINPLSVADLNSYYVPYVYDDGRHHKHRRRHHRHHHHHRKHKSNFWSGLIPRVESASSAVTIHSVELDERRPIYNTYTNERALVPVNQTERQVVSTTRTRQLADDDYVREAWVNDPGRDDEIVCCRAYNGCRCPCWCFIIFIILFVILIIILIVLLVTLL